MLTSGNSGSSAMTLDRATRLRQLGFEWEAHNPNSVPWDVRFGELLEFVVSGISNLTRILPLTCQPVSLNLQIAFMQQKKYGHCKFTTLYKKPQLSIQCVRKAYLGPFACLAANVPMRW
jgi:hypothetical protein